jgi:hypothetical protein
MTVKCLSCGRDIGGAATEGGVRVRVGIVLVDPSTGRVHGPCPHCKADVEISAGGSIAKALMPDVPAVRRRVIVPGIPRGG